MGALQVEVPRKLWPLLGDHRYKGLYGGRGGMKSHFFAERMVLAHLNPGERSLCAREFQRTLDESSKKLIEDKIDKFGLKKHGFVVKHTCIETPGDGIILFEGLRNHTAHSLKSLEALRRAWIEEAQTLSEQSLKILTPTIRYEDKETGWESELWFSWNPDDPKDPVDQLFRGPKKDPRAICVEVNWDDNPWFPNVLRKDMEWVRRTDPDMYQHVWAGGYNRKSSARVFKNYSVQDFETPADATFILGSDWGYSVDPSSLVRAFVSEKDHEGKPWPRRRLYIDHDLYRVGVEIDHLPAFFDGLVCGCQIQEDGTPQPHPCRDKENHGWARRVPIVADSARPETISYMRRNGYGGMEPAKKGANSVKEGVIFLQGFDIIIHPRCKNTIDEFGGYKYKVDPHTEIISNVLEDKKNHIIDPLRYAVERIRHAVRMRPALWA